MTTVYAAGGEDSELYLTSSGAVSTTANSFRPTYARCGLATFTPSGAAPFWQYWAPFSQSVFWNGARLWNNVATTATLNNILWRALSSDSLPRLRIRCSVAATNTFVLEKVDASGTQTTLATFVWAPTLSPTVPEKFDVFVNYAAGGEFSFYYNTVLIAQFLGDVTTNSVTALANISYGHFGNSTTLGLRWSETMVLDTDTRSLNLQTFPPVANGNTHNFDTGTPAAANVNETTLDNSTLDGSTTAGQIDGYTTGAVAAGTYGVLAYGVSVMAQKGSSGPSKLDLAVRTNGTDYFSADQTLTAAFADYQNWWANNPDTGVPWTTAQIGAASGFNVGAKSVT